MKPITVAFAGDHASFPIKEKIIKELKKLGFLVHDFGTFTADSVDYPDFVHPAARRINDGEIDFGVFVCGSGEGVAITANKHPNVRAALCWKVELAKLAKQHNDANVLCIPARFVSVRMARKMVRAFFETDFEGGRHERRVNKIPCC